MYEKIKAFFLKHWKMLCVVVLCCVVLIVGVSCSSIGDGNMVQFGLTNDNIGDSNTFYHSDF